MFREGGAQYIGDHIQRYSAGTDKLRTPKVYMGGIRNQKTALAPAAAPMTDQIMGEEREEMCIGGGVLVE